MVIQVNFKNVSTIPFLIALPIDCFIALPIICWPMPTRLSNFVLTKHNQFFPRLKFVFTSEVEATKPSQSRDLLQNVSLNKNSINICTEILNK